MNKIGQVSSIPSSRQHLESLSKKLTTRFGLLRQLADSKWGSDAKTLRTATLALIHSAAEYCAPAWCRSKHTRLVEKPIYDALRLVTGCILPTPIDNPFVLAGISPTELCRKRATLPLSRRAMVPEHLLHDRLLFSPTTQQRELKSRHVFVPAALELLKDLDKSNTTAAFWADYKWHMECWVRLNRLRTGVGLFRSTMHKWGLVPSSNCRCGVEEQTADHILASCPLYHLLIDTLGLAALDDNTVNWLQTTTFCI